MSYTPTYRGTSKKLNDELPKAKRWMVDICRRVTTDLDQPVKDEINTMLNSVMALDEGNLGYKEGFRMSVTRTWGGGYYTHRSDEDRTDYFFEWKIGQHVKHDYNEQKIIIRKNGTVHEENLSEALRIWAQRRISQRRMNDIHGQNKEEYEQHQSPGKHDNCVTVELSKSKLGMCLVSYSNTWVKLGKVHDVPIKNLNRMIELMKSKAADFANDARDVRDA